MRKFAAGLVVVLAGLMVGFVYVAGRGFSARAEPTWVEKTIALQLRSLATPRNARTAQSPLSSTPEVIRDGLEHFADHCATCHANDGGGKTQIGTGLYPKPPDLKSPRTQKLTDGELFYIIENGVRLTGMPAFGGPDTDPNDSWKLVAFIRHLPHLAPAELARMEELDPRSVEQLQQEREEEEFLRGGSTRPAPKGHTH